MKSTLKLCLKLFNLHVWFNTLNASFNRVVVVYWWRGKNDKNWGDKINKFLVKELSGKNVVHIDDIFNFRFFKVYSCVGSIIHHLKYKNVHIWGSGLIENKIPKNIKIDNISAVRGPKTRDLLKHHGYDCPEIFGDPVFLLPRIYNPSLPKQHTVGLIPHYKDKNSDIVKSLMAQGAFMIDIFGDDKEVINNVLKCRNILSSSLHGLILADSYQVPSKWIKINKLVGNHFKFDDYYNSIGINNENPISLDNHFDLSKLISECSLKKIDLCLDSLLLSCPFLINNSGFINHDVN